MCVFMGALWNRAGHYIFALWFISFFFYLFSSPNLNDQRLDVYHTSTHANLECTSEMCCTRLAENTGRKKIAISTPSPNFVRLYLRQSEKNFLNRNTFSMCPANMVNFGPLTAEICWRVWGTPANFNGFRVLTALLHGTVVVGVSQTLRRWTEGAIYIRQGGITLGIGPHSSILCAASMLK